MTPSGEVLDSRKDCYDHAFALFALSTLYQAGGDGEVLKRASRTMDVIETRFGEPEHGGYLEETTADWQDRTVIRRQNPHMHLLEAFLAFHEASGDERALAGAREIVALFRQRFRDADTGALGEHFTRDWRPDPELGHVLNIER